MAEVVISDEGSSGEVEAVQAAAALAAANQAGAAGVKAEQAQEKADDATYAARDAQDTASTALSVASETAGKAVTQEQVDLTVSEGMAKLVELLTTQLAGSAKPAPAPMPEKPKEVAPTSIKKKRTFRERWIGEQ